MVGVTEDGAENSKGSCVVEDRAEGNGGGLDGREVWPGELVRDFRKTNSISIDSSSYQHMIRGLQVPQLQMLVQTRASSAHDVVTGSQTTAEREWVLTVKRHDCDCVRLLEKVDGRFFEYLD